MAFLSVFLKAVTCRLPDVAALHEAAARAWPQQQGGSGWMLQVAKKPANSKHAFESRLHVLLLTLILFFCIYTFMRKASQEKTVMSKQGTII